MNAHGRMYRATTRAAALVAALGLVAALPGTGRAQPPAPPTGFDQVDPDLGQGLVAWSEDRGAGHRIYGKRLRANALAVGGPAGGEFALTRPTGNGGDADSSGDQRFPALGGPGLVWSERVDDTSGYDLFAQRLHGNGLPSGPPRLLLSAPGDQLFPDVIAIANGYLVVYSEDTTDEGDIMGLRFTPSLVARGVPFPIAQGEGAASDPTVARDPAEPDRLVVLFSFLPRDADNSDIYGIRLAETGSPIGGPQGGMFPVVDTPENEHSPRLVTGTFADSLRRAASNASRNVFLFVRDDATDGSDVYAQRLRANGIAYGAPFLLAGGQGAQTSPAADVLADGSDEPDWLVAWADDGAGTFDVLGLRLRINGIPRGHGSVLAGD